MLLIINNIMLNSMAQLCKGFGVHAGTVVLNGDHNRIIAIKNMDRNENSWCARRNPVQNGIFEKWLKCKLADQEIFDSIFCFDLSVQIIFMTELFHFQIKPGNFQFIFNRNKFL